MYSKDGPLMWVLLVTAGHLLWGCCEATDRGPVPSGRKMGLGLGESLRHNHLLQPGPSSGESVKISAGTVHVPHGFPAAWRMTPTVSTPLAGGWWVARKPLARPSQAGGSRGRINNRSMTRFSEVEIPAGLQQQQLDAPELMELATGPLGVENPAERVDQGLVELYRSAERSRGVENFLWKYFIDSDVSASTDDDDDDDEEAYQHAGAKGGALQVVGEEAASKEDEGRKKKFHLKKKYKKFLIPLLLAYKIKFLALVPAIIGGLILLVKAAGLAGFFFALFTAVVSLKKY